MMDIAGESMDKKSSKAICILGTGFLLFPLYCIFYVSQIYIYIKYKIKIKEDGEKEE